MRVIHHFGIRYSSDAERQEFLDLGIDLKPGARAPSGNVISSFEIGEDDPQWTRARRLAAKFRITESVRTEFDRSEIESSEAICIFASSQRGYPEPSDKGRFMSETFDLSDFCSTCGIGLRQIRPFRVKSAPDLKRSFMQLNWIFDEYFVARDTWAAVFEPIGIGYWPVLLDKTGEEVSSIVQLRVEHVTDMKLSDANATVCPVCHRKKWELDLKGFCPEPVDIPASLFKSSQYFGSGRTAFRRDLISSPLYKEMKKNSLRGIEFYPCVSSGASNLELPVEA